MSARNALIYLDADRHGRAEPAARARWQDIAVAAYFLAERRGFAPGRELDDWLEAEKAVGTQSESDLSSSPRTA